MTMQELLDNMHILFESLSVWIAEIIEMFFGNPVTFVLLAIPIVTFLIITVISIIKSLFK